MELRLTSLVFCLFGLVHSVPLLKSQSECIQQCSRGNQNFNYESGTTLIYDVETATSLESNNGRASQIKIKAQAEISVHSKCEHAMQLRNVEVEGPQNARELKYALEQHSIMFNNDDGQIVAVCPASGDDQWAVNIKKAIIAELQVTVNTDNQGTSIESEKDIFGDCETTYKVSESTWKGTKIEKSKRMDTCSNRDTFKNSLVPKTVQEEFSGSKNPALFSNDYKCEIHVQKSLVRRAKCVENNRFLSPLSPAQGANIKTTIELSLRKIVKGLTVHKPNQVGEFKRLYLEQLQFRPETQQNAQEAVRKLHQATKDGIEIEAPSQFQELIEAFRHMSAQSILQVQQQAKHTYRNEKLDDLIQDAILSAAGPGAIEIVAKEHSSGKLSAADLAQFSTSIGFAKEQTQQTVAAAAKMVKQGNLPYHAILGLTKHIGSYCKSNQCANNPFVKETVNHIEREISRTCGSQSSEEQHKAKLYIMALINIPVRINVDAVLQCAQNQQNDNTIRQFATASMLQQAQNSHVHKKMEQMASNENEDLKVRLTAFAAAIQGASESQAQHLVNRLQKSASRQVMCFVPSYIKNKQESKRPSDQKLREVLRNVQVSEPQPPCKAYEDSQNYAASYMPTNVGIAFEANVIQQEQGMVSFVDAELAMPMYGKELQLLYVMAQQDNMDNALDNALERISKKGVKEAVQEMIESWRRSNSIRRSPRSDSYYEPYGPRSAPYARHYQSGPQEPKLSVAIGTDNAIVFYLDEYDIQMMSQESLNKMLTTLQRVAQNPSQSLQGESAAGFQLINAEYKVPTANGMQAKVEMNVAAVFGFKGQGEVFQPSFAAEATMKVGYEAHKSKPGVKTTFVIQSKPELRVSTQQQPNRLIIGMPNRQVDILKIESKSYVIDENGREQPAQSGRQRVSEGCTKTTREPFGLSLCGKTETRGSPLQGDISVELTARQTDNSFKNYEFTLQAPSEGDERQVYKIGLNTPGSQMDRETAAELQIWNTAQGESKIEAHLKVPQKDIRVGAYKRWNQNEKAVKVHASVDGQNYNAELSLKSNRRGNKIEYTPLLSIEQPQTKPIQLTGTITADLGRKPQLVVDIKSDRDNLHGNVIKDSGRVSVNLDGRVQDSRFRIFGAAEASRKVISANGKLDYQINGKSKESIEIMVKTQDMSTGSLKKRNSVFELRSTQAPQTNVHVTATNMQKPGQYLENELVIMTKDFSDESRKIKVLQVSRFTNPRDKSAMTIQNKLQIKSPMHGINLDAEANAMIDRSQNPKLKIEVSAISNNQKYQTSLDFKQPSKNPLKMTVDVLLKSPARELRYSDKLEEIAPNEYKGKSIFKWRPDRQAVAEYHYKDKSNKHQVHHELNTEFKTTNMHYPTQHQAMLRMSANDVEVRTKLQHAGAPYWDINSVLSAVTKSRVFVEVPFVRLRAEASPFEASKSALVEVTGKSTPYHHQSDVQMDSDSMAFNTKTTYRRQPVFAMNSLLRSSSSRVSVEGSRFEGKFDYNLVSRPKTANLEFRSKDSQTHHKSSISAGQGQVDVRTRTQIRGQNVATLDAGFSPSSKSYFNLDSNYMKGSGEFQLARQPYTAALKMTGKSVPFTHKSHLSIHSRPQAVKLESIHMIRNEPVYNLVTYLTTAGSSNINLNTPNLITNLDVNPYSETKVAKVKVQYPRSGWEHNTNVNIGPALWQLLSQTQRSGQTYVTIDGQIGDNSHLKLVTIPLNAALTVEPQRGEFSAVYQPWRLTHRTTVQNQPQAVVIVSKTDQAGRNLFNLDSTMSPRGASHAKVVIAGWDGQVKYDPSSNTAQILVNGQPIRLSHTTEFAWLPRRQFSVDSQTLQRGRPLATVNLLVSATDKSHFKFSRGKYEGSLELAPFRRTKTAKIALKQSSPLVIHESELEYQRGHHISLNSNTEYNKQNVAGLQSLYSRVGPSHIKIASPAFDTSLIVDPQQPEQQLVKFEVQKRQGVPVYHVTKLAYQPNPVFVIVSSTKHGGRNIFDLNSRIGASDKSYVNIQALPLNAQFEINPSAYVRTAGLKIEGHAYPFGHNTQISYEPSRQITIASQTHANGEQVLGLNSVLSQIGQSHLNIDSAPYIAKFKVQPFASTRMAQVQISNSAEASHHEAEIRYKPGSSVAINSVVKHRAVPVFTLNSQLAPRSFVIIDKKPYNANFEISPFAQVKTVKFVLQDKNSGYQHSTEGSWSPSELQFVSQSSQGSQNFGKYSGLFSGQRESYLNLSGPQQAALIKVQPFGQNQYVRVVANNNADQAVHNFDLTRVPAQITIKHKYARRSQPIFNLDSILSAIGKSHLRVVVPTGNGGFELDPFGAEKGASVKLVIPAQQLQHQSTVQYQPDMLKLATSTVNRGRNAFSLESILRKSGPSTFKTNNHMFDADVLLEPKPMLKLSYTAKHANYRKIVTSIGAKDSQKNAVEFALQWDADRDQNAKIEMTVSLDQPSSRSRRPAFRVRGTYGKESHFSVDAQMGSSLINGPHDLTIGSRNAQRVSGLVIHHEVNQGKLQCTVQLTKNGKSILEIENLWKKQPTANGVVVKANLMIKSESKSVDGFKLSMSHELGRGYLQSELFGQMPGGEPAILKAQYNGQGSLQSGKANLRLTANLPLYDYKNQELTLRSEWNNRKGEVNVNAVANSGKKVQLEAKYDNQREGASASVKVDSDFDAIPDTLVDGLVRGLPNPQLSFNVNAEGKRYVELAANGNYNGYKNFAGHIIADSIATPRIAFDFHGKYNGREIDYSSVLKKQEAQVFVTRVKAQKSRNSVNAQGLIAAQGADLIALELNMDNSADGLQKWTAQLKGAVQPIKVQYNQKQSRGDYKYGLQICPLTQQGSNQCYTYDVQYQDRSSGRSTDQTVHVLVKNQFSGSQYGAFYVNQDNKNLMVNKLDLNANGQKLGYHYELNQQKSTALARVQIGQRVAEIRGKSEDQQSGTRVSAELLSDAVRQPDNKLQIEFTHNDISAGQNRQVRSEVKASHPSMKEPVSLQFHYDQRNQDAAKPLSVQFHLNAGSRPSSKLYFQAAYEHPNGQQNNNSISINLYSQDRRTVDTGLTVSLATEGEKYVQTHQMHYTNRRGQKSQAYYQIVVDTDNQQVRAEAQAGQNQLQATAKWNNDKDKSITGDLTVNGDRLKGFLSLTTGSSPCLQAELNQEPAVPLYKVKACVSAEGKSVLKLTTETYSGGKKTTGNSIVYDKRNGQTLKAHLRWDPRSMSETLYAIANIIRTAELDLSVLNLVTDEIQQQYGEIYREIKKNIINPLYATYSREYNKLAQEAKAIAQVIARDLKPLLDALPDIDLPDFGEIIDKINEYVSNIIPKSWVKAYSKAIDRLARAATETCAKSDLCFTAARIYERHGFSGLVEKAGLLLEKAAKDARKVVFIVKGQIDLKKVGQLLSQYAQEVQNAASAVADYAQDAYNWLIESSLGKAIGNAAQAVGENINDAIDAAGDALNSVAELLLQNEDIAALFKFLYERYQEIKRELQKSSALDNIQSLTYDAVALAVNPLTWPTHSRVMVWNPEHGEILVQIQLPGALN